MTGCLLDQTEYGDISLNKFKEWSFFSFDDITK